MIFFVVDPGKCSVRLSFGHILILLLIHCFAVFVCFRNKCLNRIDLNVIKALTVKVQPTNWMFEYQYRYILSSILMLWKLLCDHGSSDCR